MSHMFVVYSKNIEAKIGTQFCSQNCAIWVRKQLFLPAAVSACVAKRRPVICFRRPSGQRLRPYDLGRWL